MRVLVTGGAGFLGSVLVTKLLEKGYRVTIFDILMFGGEGIIAHMSNTCFSLLKGDIRDNNLLKNIFLHNDFDVVVHLAALVGEPACEEDPKLAEDINCKATIELAKLAKEMGIKRLIFTSSSSNYGVSKPNELADENAHLNPLTLYAKTKVDAEKGLLPLNGSGFAVCVVRFAAFFGLSPKMRFNLLINELVRDAYFEKDIVLYKENAWRPYTHTEDASDAIIAILEAKESAISGQIFNVGTENYKKKDLITMIRKHVKNIKVVKKGGESDNRDYKVSFEKIKKTLGFVPKKSVADGIEELFWAMENNVFSNPYDEKHSAWINKAMLHL